jgi:AraC-like DNA-binding protein
MRRYANQWATLSDLLLAHDLAPPASVLPLNRERYAQICQQVRPLLERSPIPTENYRIMGSYVASAATLAEVAEKMAGFAQLLGNGNAISLDTQNQRISLDAVSHVALAQSAYQAVLPTLYAAQLYNFLCWLANAPLALEQLELQTAPTAEIAVYRRLFDTRVRFGCAGNVFHFREGELARPQVRDNAEVTQFFTSWHSLLIMAPVHSQTIEQRVAHLLLTGFGKRPSSLAEIASALRLPPTTLRNQLRKEGTSFQKIKDESRMKLARNYLIDSQLPIENIAMLLGYSEVSNFYQSFRRYFSVTPASLRANGNDR